MKIKINDDVTLSLTFRYTWEICGRVFDSIEDLEETCGQAFGLPKRVTTATLRHLVNADTAMTLVQGTVRRSPSDPDNLFQARKYALRQALKKTSHHTIGSLAPFTIHEGLTIPPEIRAAIWKAYFATVRAPGGGHIVPK